MSASLGAAERHQTLSRTYLTIGLRGRTFALAAAHACSIAKVESVARVPCAPPFVLGLVNIRAKIVPLVSLALRMEFWREHRTGRLDRGRS